MTVFSVLQVNCFGVRPLSVKTPSHIHQIVVGSNRYEGLSFKTNAANISAEASIVEKESTSSVEKIGNFSE